jgi:hypothetical protein
VLLFAFWSLEVFNFGFVSGFVLRISNFIKARVTGRLIPKRITASKAVRLGRYEPAAKHLGTGTPQLDLPGPILPVVLQKPSTAHLASSFTFFSIGFSYRFFPL